MIQTCHLLAGAALAVKFKTAYLGLFLALPSHYLLDMIPHAEYSVNHIIKGQWKDSFIDFSKVALDFLVGGLLILTFTQNIFLAGAGACLSVLPDGLNFLFILFPKNRLLQAHHDFHEKIHYSKNKKTPRFWGISSQLIIVILSIILLSLPS